MEDYSAGDWGHAKFKVSKKGFNNDIEAHGFIRAVEKRVCRI